MIFDIRYQHGVTYFVAPTESDNYDPFILQELLQDCFPTQQYIICCFDGYENSVCNLKDHSHVTYNQQ